MLETPESIGNMTYGYLGSAMGYSQFALLKGGDYADGGIRGFITTSDSEEDKENIRKGVNWYKETH